LSVFSSSFVEGGPSATVTPFNPTILGTNHQGSDSWAEQQQLLSEPSDAEISSDPYSLSSTPAPVLPRSRPVAPVPAGLSSKELARLRVEALSSSQTHSNPSSNTSQSSMSPSSERSRATSTSDTRRLQTEVESLRREMQQLRVERLEAPPSYTEGDA
jgi:hypothetical protein